MEFPVSKTCKIDKTQSGDNATQEVHFSQKESDNSSDWYFQNHFFFNFWPAKNSTGSFHL